jgi:hypothetical protein
MPTACRVVSSRMQMHIDPVLAALLVPFQGGRGLCVVPGCVLIRMAVAWCLV